MTLLTLIVLGLLLSLGRWQLQRADQKRALFDSFAAGADGTLTIEPSTPPVARYRHVTVRGAFDATRQVLIDNMVSAEGQAGYYVITPFALEGGGWILVNRGWVPVGASRAQRPDIPVDGSVRSIHGRADNLPSPGIQLGSRVPLTATFPVVAAFPNHAEIEQLLREPNWNRAADVILLDPQEPGGYERKWLPPGFPPLRHIGYAVQWFGLAAALVVIYFVTNTRKATP
jgi:surfeit locus 1 family protein